VIRNTLHGSTELGFPFHSGSCSTSSSRGSLLSIVRSYAYPLGYFEWDSMEKIESLELEAIESRLLIVLGATNPPNWKGGDGAA
jgi:hypothetical protein